ncbi:MAG: hypothetical protein Q8L06_06935, partial [Pseudohongiella sp.]|nr:hypothetical protein [Pseudohongiella sp.]
MSRLRLALEWPATLLDISNKVGLCRTSGRFESGPASRKTGLEGKPDISQGKELSDILKNGVDIEFIVRLISGRYAI